MAAVATSTSTVRTSIPLMTSRFESGSRAPSDFRLDLDFIDVQGVGPHLRRLARVFFQTSAFWDLSVHEERTFACLLGGLLQQTLCRARTVASLQVDAAGIAASDRLNEILTRLESRSTAADRSQEYQTELEFETSAHLKSFRALVATVATAEPTAVDAMLTATPTAATGPAARVATASPVRPPIARTWQRSK